MTKPIQKRLRASALGASALCVLAVTAQADQVFLDDLIVDGSACIGQDCVNGESFGFDTIRIKENNLRIKAQDTSSTASFPTVDWQLTFNESSNGGQNKFSVDEIDGNKTPLTIEAGTRSNAIYTDGSNVGFGTSTPVVTLHAQSGNTPTLRLQQDGSSGFAQQTWDVAGNESGFFIRDATNGSTLPFRIIPGASSQSLVIDDDDDIGIGAGVNPNARLHISNGGTVQAAPNAGDDMIIQDDGAVRLAMINLNPGTGTNQIWTITNNNTLRLSAGTDDPEFELDETGNLTVEGNFISGTTTLNVPDYVFADDYELRPLSEVRAFIEANSHLPEVPSANEVYANGLNMSEMQMTLLKKVEELTLYTLAQQDEIARLNEKLETLSSE